MKKIGIRILGCMALLSMVGCGRIEGASVQDLSNTKDAIVESETTPSVQMKSYSFILTKAIIHVIRMMPHTRLL